MPRNGTTATAGAERERRRARRAAVLVIGGGIIGLACARELARRGRQVLIAAGAWSGRGGRIRGLPPLPIEPIKGQMIRVEGVAWPWTGNLFSGHHYAVRRGPSSLLIGATVEEVGFDTRLTARGLADLLGWVRRLLPDLSFDAISGAWAGLRPATPDRLPIIGTGGGDPAARGSAAGRLHFATAHHRAGILLAPWTARVVADLIIEGRSAPELAAFSPDRFLTRPSAAIEGHRAS